MKKTSICGLYRFKNENDEIIYIGKADNIQSRLMSHGHLPMECYVEIDKIEYASILNKADRDILELVLITQLQPKYNTSSKYREKSTIIDYQSIELNWIPIDDIKQYNLIKKRQTYIKSKIKHSEIKDNIKQEYIKTHPPGRPVIDIEKIPKNFKYYQDLVQNHQMTIVDASKQLNISRPTFYKYQKIYLENIDNK